MDIYDLLPNFPVEERFNLCAQIRRAAYSVPMNIVEGNIKRSNKEKLRYIEHSEGSLEELDYQLFLSQDRGYITQEKFEALRNAIGKVSYLLTQFRKGVKQSKK